MSTAKTQEKFTAEKNVDSQDTGKVHCRKYDRRMLAGKATPRGSEKRAGEPKGENQNGLGVGEGAIQKHDRPMLAGRPSQGDQNKRPGEPKGENQNGLGVGEGAVQKYDRPMLAGEAKPRGPEEKTWRTERRELRSVGGLCKAPSKTLSADAGREGKAKWT